MIQTLPQAQSLGFGGLRSIFHQSSLPVYLYGKEHTRAFMGWRQSDLPP